MFLSCWKVKIFVSMLMYFQTVIFMQKSLFGDTYWKAWPLGLFFSMHRTRWSKGIFEGSQPWNTRLSMPELKQNKAQCMPYFGVSYLPLAYAGLHSHPRLCPHLRRHQVQSEDGQSCFLGPVAPAVSRGRLSLLIWLLNPSQLLMRCLTNILRWTNVQICRLLIWTRASACSKSFRAMAGNCQSHEVWGAEWEWIPVREAGYPEWPLDGWRVWVCAASGISVISVLCLRPEWRVTRVCSYFQG